MRNVDNKKIVIADIKKKRGVFVKRSLGSFLVTSFSAVVLLVINIFNCQSMETVCQSIV